MCGESVRAVTDDQAAVVPLSPWVAGRRKRVLDLLVGSAVTVASAPLVAALIVAATIDTKSFGLFRQQRVGKDGKLFTVFKVRTMGPSSNDSTVTVHGDHRITRLGAVFRAYKLDEFPQFWNVARGTMSLVGPRPDVAGYLDTLEGADAQLLELRPGITGPATLFFRDEEALLAAQYDPVAYNDEIVWPRKVALNLAYARHGTLADDLRMVFLTLKASPDLLDTQLMRWKEV
ncbi:UNVERIFIED_CONTAM: hypothetical protein GTU68_063332 [Idotea baltica]|nr:hypothetical protein [Idotea baltica]